MTQAFRVEALLSHLRVEDHLLGHDDVSVEADNTFSVDGFGEFRVLTIEEARAAAAAYIADSLWAFRAEFICEACGLPPEMAPIIQAGQEKLCEGMNEALTAIVDRMCRDQAELGSEYEEFLAGIPGATDGGLAVFALLAVRADGLGHFLATYDHEEHSVSVDGGEDYGTLWFHIFRTN